MALSSHRQSAQVKRQFGMHNAAILGQIWCTGAEFWP
jgi:hypothetical protein